MQRVCVVGFPMGLGDVLLASMGGMPSQATCQKAGRLALANANVPIVCLLLRFFLFVKHFCDKGMGCVVGFPKGLEVYC